MTDPRRAASVHAVTELIHQALDCVDATISRDPKQISKGLFDVFNLSLSPVVGSLFGPLVGLLGQAANQVAEATGTTPQEVVAGWRTKMGNGLDAAEELYAAARNAVAAPVEPGACGAAAETCRCALPAGHPVDEPHHCTANDCNGKWLGTYGSADFTMVQLPAIGGTQ